MKKSADLPKLIHRHLGALNRGKKGYKLADALLDQIEPLLKPGEIVKLPNGKPYQFVDKFEGKTKINVGQNARRYEFKEVETA